MNMYLMQLKQLLTRDRRWFAVTVRAHEYSRRNKDAVNVY